MKASERAYAALRQDIVEWRLTPGTVLAEVEQSARLGVSRTPLRDALRQLMADGLAEPHAGRGVVVTHVTAAQVDALFEARVALDTASASLAARRGDPEIFAALAEAFEQAARAFASHGETADVSAYYRLISDLDAAITDASANPYLERAQVPLRANLARLRRTTQERISRLTDSAAEHAAIARAISAQDPELAAAATRLHLSNARNAINLAVDHLNSAHDHLTSAKAS